MALERLVLQALEVRLVLLEGLHQHNLVAREASDEAFRYTDMLATMLKDPQDA